MDHLAIMRKSWKLLPKILNKEKKIESRWYMARFSPWDKVKKGDTIYFKDAGDAVRLKANVDDVLQFERYDKKELKKIFDRYAKDICFHDALDEAFSWARKRKYCILMFLTKPELIKPFTIDKTGYGNANAWISVDDINEIKAKS